VLRLRCVQQEVLTETLNTPTHPVFVGDEESKR